MTIVETMDSGERGMNPVAMTIIDPQKEYWPSQGLNQQPLLKSAMLSTELWENGPLSPIPLSYPCVQICVVCKSYIKFGRLRFLRSRVLVPITQLVEHLT